MMKISALCKDSILVAPLVIDLVRLMNFQNDVAKAAFNGKCPVFFKAPYQADNEQPIHDLFKQYDILMKWLETKKDNKSRSLKFDRQQWGFPMK